MIRSHSRIIALAAAAAMMISALAGCGNSSTSGNAASSSSPAANSTATATAAETVKKLDPVELNFYFPGDPIPDQQAVLDEVYNRTKDTLNAKIVFNWVPWGELKNKLAVKLAAGENMDSVFDAQWNQLPQMISKGTYLKLDEYFNNDKYPGLKKVFSPEYVENNKFVDAAGEMHVYGVPFTRDYGQVTGYVIRQDLREKYGLPEIKDLAGLEAYFDAVLKNEGGKIIPLGTTLTGGLGNFLADYQLNIRAPFVTAADGLYFRVVINSDKTVNLVLPGEDSTLFPEPEIQRRWYTMGYLEKDVVSQKDANGLFKAGKFAAVPADQSALGSLYRETQQNIPGAKLEMVLVNPDTSAHAQHIIPTEFKAWNFACIPANSKNAERTMMFLDWIFADQKNHDLIEYGIEGKHWVADGNDKYKIPDGVDSTKNYSFPGYVLTWNSNYVRYDSNLPQSGVDVLKYASDINTYIKIPLAGFTFNAEPVKNELAKCGPESKKVVSLADVGLFENAQQKYKELNTKMEKMGLEKIREEMKKQVEAFLASQK